jgi:PKD repeat protein
MIFMAKQGDHIRDPIILRAFLCCFFICASVGIGSCESVVVSEWRYGGSNDDWGYGLVAHPDGPVVMAGMSYSNDGDISFQNGGGDLWIIAVDLDGTKLWDKSYGGTGSDYALYAIPVSSGGYILCGATGSEDGDIVGYNGYGDGWILRLDSDGNLLWSLVLGGSDKDELGSIIENKDGTFTAVGYTFSNDGDISEQRGAGDAWVVRVSADGKLMSSKTYGGSGRDAASSVLETKDGNLVIIGTTYSQDISPTFAGKSDVWIFSVTPEGEMIWNRTFGGSDVDFGHALCEKDGYYYVAAATTSHDGDVKQLRGASDIWVLKLNQAGDLIWSKTYGGSFSENVWDIKPMGDGLIIIGETYSVDGDITKNPGSLSTWVLFIDSEGTLLWQECIGGERASSGQRVRPIDDKSAWILSYGQDQNSHLGSYVLAKIVLPEIEQNASPLPLDKPLLPFPGQNNLPRDLDGSGLYADINGNGRLEFADLAVFFEHMDWISENQPIALFDFNRNGRIDFGDLQALQEIIEKALG